MSWTGEERRKNGRQDDVTSVLARIDERLANFIKMFENHSLEVEKKFDRHNERIGTLEQGYWKAIGALALVIVVFEIGIKLIGK